MARIENYFHPVKNLLTAEHRKSLIDRFRQYQSAHIQEKIDAINHDENIIRGFYVHRGYDRAGYSYEDFAKGFKLYVKEELENFNPDCYAQFHTNLTNPDMIFDSGTELFSVGKEIMKLYGGENFCYLYTFGAGQAIRKHTDPLRNCNLTIPLFPDYDVYRNCLYYENFESEEIFAEVDYAKIRNPVLLNSQRVHATANSNIKESLAFQILYNHTMSYVDVRKVLSEKGFLI